MCGICGLVQRESAGPVDGPSLERMNEALRHRGPDDGHVWVGPAAGIGARRLSVIDVAHGRQPMISPDGRHVVAFNGELYNFRDLRQTLESLGRVFETRCDTEVVLAAFEQWGKDALSRFNGMFAVAWYDTVERSLLLARDRVGIKPLYYTHQRGRIAFASELRALRAASGFVFDIDPAGLDQYLAYLCVPAPRTIYRDVFKLDPSSYLLWKDEAVHTERYWEPQLPQPASWSVGEAAERFRATLHEVVQRQLVSDVPVGAFLSGGMDSSAIVAAMAAAGGPLDTFTVGFRDAEYDERPYARAVAERYGARHHETLVHLDAVDALDHVAAHFGEPFADSSALPALAISRMARERVTVALSGDGGDELFAGYHWLHTNRRVAQLRRVPSVARTLLALPASLAPQTATLLKARRFLADADLSPVESFRRRHTAFTAEQRAALYTADAAAALGREAPWDPFLEHANRAMAAAKRGAVDDDWMLLHDFSRYLPDDVLTKVDRMSMAVSLEVRVPLLDNAMVEFAFQVPFAMKYRDGASKWLMKEALRDALPGSILQQRKQGFSVPVHRWFQGALGDRFRETVLAPNRPLFAYIDQRATARLLRDHREGVGEHGHRLWALQVLDAWLAQSPHA